MVGISKDKLLMKNRYGFTSSPVKLRSLERGAGFTLLELTMVIVLLAIIAGATVPLMFKIIDGWGIARQQNDISESARLAMDRMIREIRQIKDTNSITTAGADIFQFVDTNNNTVRFDLVSNTLRRSQAGAVYNLADNVTALSFTYYDGSDAVIASPTVSPSVTNIKRIVVSLTINSGGIQLVSQSGVSPRRLNE